MSLKRSPVIRIPFSLLLLTLMLWLIAGCSQESSVGPSLAAEPTLEEILAQLPDESSMVPAAPNFGASADVVHRWYDLTDRIIRTEKLNPPVASRLLGYMGLSLYETVEPGGRGYRSLAGQVNGLNAAPALGSVLSHWPTAANYALATTIKGILTAASSASIASVDSLRRLIDSEQNRKHSRLFVLFGMARGMMVSQHVLNYSNGDGFSLYNNCAYSAPIGPGLWIPTPPAFAAPLQPCWGELRPFVISRGNICEPIPPTPYSTDTASVCFKESMEVYTTSKNLTAEQAIIASYWADGGGTATPPGHSVAILTQLLREKDAKLFEVAECYAKVGMAVADAFIACWWTKYEYNVLRPVTYIRENIDSTWLPMIATPPFPEYTSGHSVQSGAAAEVMTNLFGSISFTDKTQVPYGSTARSFASFYAAANEAAISRLYGGIHYTPAIELGVEQGRCVGSAVNSLKTRRGNHAPDLSEPLADFSSTEK